MLLALNVRGKLILNLFLKGFGIKPTKILQMQFMTNQTLDRGMS